MPLTKPANKLKSVCIEMVFKTNYNIVKNGHAERGDRVPLFCKRPCEKVY